MMGDGNGFISSGGVWRSLRDGDFEEEDVWAVLEERRNFCPDLGEFPESPAVVAVKRHLPSAARMVPKTKPRILINSDGSSSTSSDEIKQQQQPQQQSAPVKINHPDWSNLSNKKRSTNDDEGLMMNGYGEPGIDDDWYSSKVPPHEIVARRLARSQISSFSVLEGVGRKLKGRDLRKVRNAVLTRTGFLE